MTDPDTDFSKAMAALGGDSPTAVADALGEGITRQVVEYWQAKGRVPAERGPLVERKCWERGHAVEVEALCPGRSWHRVKDKAWPNPKGRPLLDVAKEAA